MSQKKQQSTDPEILGELAALRRAAMAARRLAKATGTPLYVMKNGQIVDLMAGNGKRREKKVGNGRRRIVGNPR
jgi:hypothetical protein